MTAVFPIPHMSQGPDDDLAHAMSLLEVVFWSFTDASQNGMTKDVAQDLFAVLCDMKLTLDPVMLFLNDLHYEGMIADYRKARRALILKSYNPSSELEDSSSLPAAPGKAGKVKP